MAEWLARRVLNVQLSVTPLGRRVIILSKLFTNKILRQTKPFIPSGSIHSGLKVLRTAAGRLDMHHGKYAVLMAN